MSTASQTPARLRPPDAPAVSLRCWFLYDRPLLSIAIVLALVTLAGFLCVATDNLLGASLAIAALILDLRRIWLPIWFRIESQGITRQVSGQTRRIPWSAVARYEICRRGAVLFPYGADYRLGAGQGLFIPWAGHHDEIVALLQQFGPRGDLP